MLWKGSRGNSRMSWKRAGDTVQTLVPHGEALPLWLYSEDQMELVQEAHRHSDGSSAPSLDM